MAEEAFGKHEQLPNHNLAQVVEPFFANYWEARGTLPLTHLEKEGEASEAYFKGS